MKLIYTMSFIICQQSVTGVANIFCDQFIINPKVK
jgi:hypothetical protein